jgi:5-formyltetrahydrofolate cyclo-ligase
MRIALLIYVAALVTNQILASTEYQNARAISIFLSMPGKEISTSDIVTDALTKGKAVYVPYIYSFGQNPRRLKVMDMLRLKDVHDFQSLQPDNWGIPSLSSDSVGSRENALGGTGLQTEDHVSPKKSPCLDMIFVPAVAFDHANRRLGHGKGFYDRYLSRYHAAIAANAGSSKPSLGGSPFLSNACPTLRI